MFALRYIMGTNGAWGTAEKTFGEFLELFKKRADENVNPHLYVTNLTTAIKSSLAYPWYQKCTEDQKEIIRKLIAIKLYVEVSGDDIYDQVDIATCRKESPSPLKALDRFIEFTNNPDHRADKSEKGRQTLTFKDEVKKNLEIPVRFFEPQKLMEYIQEALHDEFVKSLEPSEEWRQFCISLKQHVSAPERFAKPELHAQVAAGFDGLPKPSFKV